MFGVYFCFCIFELGNMNRCFNKTVLISGVIFCFEF